MGYDETNIERLAILIYPGFIEFLKMKEMTAFQMMLHNL